MVPSAILLSGLQRLLQAHARRGQKARRRLFHRQHVHLLLEFLLRRQFGRAVLAAPDVLLQLVPRVVSQLVVQIKRRVLLYPFAIHDDYLLLLPSARSYRTLFRAARSFWVPRNNVFFAVSSVVFKISPMVRSFKPW